MSAIRTRITPSGDPDAQSPGGVGKPFDEFRESTGPREYLAQSILNSALRAGSSNSSGDRDAGRDGVSALGLR